MYGVVLLLAVTAGGESADLGRKGGRGCSGCCGYVTSCSGCCGYVTSCSGCCGYVTSCSGCRGYVTSCHGCCGHVTSCHGCCGHVVRHGCCGHVVTHGCCGTVVPGHQHKKVASASPNAATVVVTLPEDAKLTIDGSATTSTSSVRTFETPDLKTGKTYSYTLEATFQVDGKAVVVSKKVQIEAGKTTNIDLSQTPATGVARN